MVHMNQEEDIKRLEIPRGLKTTLWEKPVKIMGRCVLIVADFHIPFHDPRAIETCILTAKKKHKNIDTVLFNGDFYDFYSISRFDKDPTLPRIKAELKMGKKIMDIFREQFNGCKFYYKIGNHEERLRSYLTNKAPELVDLKELQLEKVAGIEDMELIESLQFCTIGDLSVLHGHELAKGSINMVNPARTLFLKTIENSIQAHSHRVSMNTGKTLSQKVIKTYSMGCLCGLAPAYWVNNQWSHGYVVVERIGRKGFKVNNYRMEDKETPTMKPVKTGLKDVLS